AMSMNRIVSTRSALNAKPRLLSVTGYPSNFASWRTGAGSRLDMSNRMRAKGSGRSGCMLGKVTGVAADDERWRLKSATGPSSVVSERIDEAISNGSPSVDSPSVMCTTVGGYDVRCEATHASSVDFARRSAAHIGVPPTGTARLHRGHRN